MRSDNGTIKQTLCSPIVLAKSDQSFRFLSEDRGNTLSKQIRYFVGFIVGFRLLWCSVVFTVESLYWFYLLLYFDVYILGDDVYIC